MPWWGAFLVFIGGGLWTVLCVMAGAAITASNRKESNQIHIPNDLKGLD